MRLMGLFEAAISWSESFTLMAATASARWWGLVAPIMGAVMMGLWSNHARAIGEGGRLRS